MAMKLSIGVVLVIVLIIAEAEGMQERQRMSRFLAEQKKPKAVKCKKYPQVCVTNKNSAGPYCCKNKCVNVLTDNHNCGRCKHKCKFSTGCCNGICTNLAFDTSNCGRCGNKCKKGAYCAYGMCSYS